MWVTGASSRIGRAITEDLGSLGAHAAGGQADDVVFDVMNTAGLQSSIEGAAPSTGRLGDMGSIVDGDPAMWKAMLDMKVLALAAGLPAGADVHVLTVGW